MADGWEKGTGNWAANGSWCATENGSTGNAFPVAGNTANLGTGSGTLTVAATAACDNLLANANFTGTLAGSSALNIALSLTLGANGNYTYTGALGFNGTSGTGIITSNGKQLSCPITFNGSGGAWQLADAFNSTTSITHTLGTWNCNSKTVQMSAYNSAGASTRALIGAGSAWTVTGTGSVINTVSTLTVTSPPDSITINDASATGKTFAGGGLTWNDLTFGGSGSGTLTLSGTGTVLRDFTVSNSGSAGVAISQTVTWRNLDCTGWAGVMSGAAGVTCKGNWTWVSGMATPTWSGTLTVGGTSGTQTITSGSKTFAGAVTVNNPGATAQLGDAFVSSGAFTHTAGTFSSNGKSAQSTTFVSTASNTRGITLDSTTWTVTSTGTVINISGTGLTYSQSGGSFVVSDASASSKTVNVTIAITLGDLSFTGAGSGTLALIGSDSTTPTWRDIAVANTGGAGFSFSTGISNFRNLDFTSYTGVWSGTRAGNCTGNVTLGSGMGTITANPILTFVGTSGTQSIASNGVSSPVNWTINNSGTAVCSLADALTTTNLFTVTGGAFTTNAKAFTCRSFVGSGAATRSVTIDNAVTTVTRATTGTAWDCSTTTGLTLSTTGSEIKLNGVVTGATITFAGGSKTYHYLTLIGAAGVTSGGYVVSGSNSFDKLEIQGTGGTAQRVALTDGTTQTVTRFVAQGVSGGRFALNTTGGTAAYLSKASGYMTEMDYVDIGAGVVATGGALWFAGRNSTIANNNNGGWRLTDKMPRPMMMAA